MAITPEWVQVGNETGNGMLWNEGKADISMANYARLNNAGYDAVKSVFPNAKVIVHLQEGDRSDLFNWIFDGLKSNGGKWDVIGMSLYPEIDEYITKTEACVANMKALTEKFGCEVMMCEVGMAAADPEHCKEWLLLLRDKTKDMKANLGMFYWEPQCYGDWKAYGKGAFDDNGKPTVAMDAFAK